MSTLDYHGYAVHYWRDSPGSGPPIVFLHNGGSSHRIWTPQIVHFAATNDVIAVDMLGFGESDKPDLDYTLDLYVDMLGELLDELDLRDVALVGNCIGSATVLTYTRDHPERVRGVVAINVLTSETIRCGLTGPLVRAARRSPRAARMLGAIPTPKPVARLYAHSQLANANAVDPEMRAYLRDRYRDRAQTRVLMSIAANMDSFAPLDSARAVDGPPVMVIWGEENRILPADVGWDLCTALRPQRDLAVPAAGHLVMLERPDVVTGAIESFLAGLPRAGAATASLELT